MSDDNRIAITVETAMDVIPLLETQVEELSRKISEIRFKRDGLLAALKILRGGIDKTTKP